MTQIRFYSEDPGNAILTAFGPGINVIERIQQLLSFVSGDVITTMIGSVVNDLGRVNEPIKLASIGTLSSSFGGFKAGLVGDNTDGYEGDLFAQVSGLDFPEIILVIPDLAIKDVSISPGPAVDLTVRINQGVGNPDGITVAAGTRMKPAAGSYTIATLEAVTFDADETGDKEVRCRFVSGTPVDLSTVDTFIDVVSDSNVTITTVDTTVPDDIDAAELVLRYGDAINHATDNAAGQAASVVFCDRNELAILDLLATHQVTASAKGFFRIATGSPPIGTPSTVAVGAASDGVKRATLTRDRFSYAYPGVQRSFLLDSDNLVSPDFLATFTSAAVWAARIANERPEQNPANPHPVLVSYGIVGPEVLPTPNVGDEIIPTNSTLWAAGIVQPILEFDPVTKVTQASFFSGILADIDATSGKPIEVADRRMTDFVIQRLIQAALPFHKGIATDANQEGLADAAIATLGDLRDLPDQRIRSFLVTFEYDIINQNFFLEVDLELLGNINNITIKLNVSPTAITVEA